MKTSSLVVNLFRPFKFNELALSLPVLHKVNKLCLLPLFSLPIFN